MSSELYGIWDHNDGRWWATQDGCIYARESQALVNAQKAAFKRFGRNYDHHLQVCRFREDGTPVLRESKGGRE